MGRKTSSTQRINITMDILERASGGGERQEAALSKGVIMYSIWVFHRGDWHKCDNTPRKPAPHFAPMLVNNEDTSWKGESEGMVQTKGAWQKSSEGVLTCAKYASNDPKLYLMTLGLWCWSWYCTLVHVLYWRFLLWGCINYNWPPWQLQQIIRQSSFRSRPPLFRLLDLAYCD